MEPAGDSKEPSEHNAGPPPLEGERRNRGPRRAGLYLQPHSKKGSTKLTFGGKKAIKTSTIKKKESIYTYTECVRANLL